MGHYLEVCLALLAIWILLSGLDDLFIDLVYFSRRSKPFPFPPERALARAPQRRIAILVPLWREHAVIEQMLRHNLSVILYGNYDVFVGVYPNDPLTMEAVNRVVSDDARVHLVVCPRDGPTSKGDCLNAAYAGMAAHEQRTGISFEILIPHDAEDLIHPESLRLINWFSREYQMVQIPVLPLRTPPRAWVHGLYCDEFAEFQLKDIPVRQALGGFLPSNGVGTGFERSAAESLRRQHQKKLFDPECLTEDYENGFRMHAAGYRQIFIPIHWGPMGPMATREYFPKGWRDAVRQRSRWVLGIGLQGWQRHGWRVSATQAYWLWRDRKGLVGNLLTPIANLLFFGWIAAWLATGIHGFAGLHLPGWLSYLCIPATCFSVLQAAVRYRLCARIYGRSFAATAPLRIFVGNVINCVATASALRQFAMARAKHRAFLWRKTEHTYDTLAVARPNRPLLGEVLLDLRAVTLSDLEDALLHKAIGQRIGEYLVKRKKITAIDLDQALASQSRFLADAWIPVLAESQTPGAGNRGTQGIAR